MEECKLIHLSVARMINLGMMDGLLIGSKSQWHTVPWHLSIPLLPHCFPPNDTIIHPSHTHRLAPRSYGG